MSLGENSLVAAYQGRGQLKSRPSGTRVVTPDFLSKLSVRRTPPCSHSPSIRLTSRVLLFHFQVLSACQSVSLSLSTSVAISPLSLIAASRLFSRLPSLSASQISSSLPACSIDHPPICFSSYRQL